MKNVFFSRSISNISWNPTQYFIENACISPKRKSWFLFGILIPKNIHCLLLLFKSHFTLAMIREDDRKHSERSSSQVKCCQLNWKSLDSRNRNNVLFIFFYVRCWDESECIFIFGKSISKMDFIGNASCGGGDW